MGGEDGVDLGCHLVRGEGGVRDAGGNGGVFDCDDADFAVADLAAGEEFVEEG